MTIKKSLEAALKTYDESRSIVSKLIKGDHEAIKAVKALSDADQNNSFKVMRCFFEHMPAAGTEPFKVYQMLASKITAHLSEADAQKLSTIVLHALYTNNLLTEELFNTIISQPQNIQTIMIATPRPKEHARALAALHSPHRYPNGHTTTYLKSLPHSENLMLKLVIEHHNPPAAADTLIFLKRTGFLDEIDQETIISVINKQIDPSVLIKALSIFNTSSLRPSSDRSFFWGKQQIAAIIMNENPIKFAENVLRGMTLLKKHSLENYKDKIIEHENPNLAAEGLYALKEGNLIEKEDATKEQHFIDAIMGHRNPYSVATFLAVITDVRSEFQTIHNPANLLDPPRLPFLYQLVNYINERSAYLRSGFTAGTLTANEKNDLDILELIRPQNRQLTQKEWKTLIEKAEQYTSASVHSAENNEGASASEAKTDADITQTAAALSPTTLTLGDDDDDTEEQDPNAERAEAASQPNRSTRGALSLFRGRLSQSVAAHPKVPNVFEDNTFSL